MASLAVGSLRLQQADASGRHTAVGLLRRNLLHIWAHCSSAAMDSDDSADDDRCEMCGVDPTTRASNLTKRTLMTNAPTGQRCGHRFCGACVERGSQASKGQGSFPCPALGCGAPVRRATLDPRRLDAIEVARDASARARTLAVHNKPRDAFATRRDYDDYLEERENVVHALTCVEIRFYGAFAEEHPTHWLIPHRR